MELLNALEGFDGPAMLGTVLAFKVGESEGREGGPLFDSGVGVSLVACVGDEKLASPGLVGSVVGIPFST